MAPSEVGGTARAGRQANGKIELAAFSHYGNRGQAAASRGEPGKAHKIRLGDEALTEEAEKNGTNEKKETTFDWVAARSACTLPKVYRQLMAEAEQDVKERNALRPDNSPYEFFIEEKGPQFSVILKAADFRRAITFGYEDHAITVVDASGNQMFEITLLFTDDGKCRLKAKEENRESWQVRRMALEDLLFRTI